jgi:hypothetical protein
MEEMVEHIPCGLGREEIYPHLDWVDRYMTYRDTLWDTVHVIISRVLGPVVHTRYRMVHEDMVVCNNIQEPLLTHGGVQWSFGSFPPGRPPDRVLDFIIRIKDNHGLIYVEMQYEYDDQTTMIRMVQRQHGGISLRLVWDPGIAVVDNLTTDTDGIASLHRFGCWEEWYSKELIEFIQLMIAWMIRDSQAGSCDNTSQIRAMRRGYSTFSRMVWDPGIIFRQIQSMEHQIMITLLEEKQSWGGRICNVPFLVGLEKN